nr:hypothetical protein [Desulfofundulus thermobenzoicus]
MILCRTCGDRETAVVEKHRGTLVSARKNPTLKTALFVAGRCNT